MTHSPAAIIRLPRSLKIAAAATAVLAAIDVIATVAWTAGAPSAVVIPIWIGRIGLLLAVTAIARRHGWLPRMGPKR
jgi:hypothetical protein